MKGTLLIAVVGLWISLGSQTRAIAGDLSKAKELYATASYEEALGELTDLDDQADEQVVQYRALCLLALGRNKEAERAVEALIVRKPLYSPSSDEVSPRLTELFYEVRQHVLPGLAREMYTEARAAFDTQQFDSAVRRFRALLDILVDVGATDEQRGLADIKRLAAGFLQLSQTEVASAPAQTAPPTALESPPDAISPVIYTAQDVDVVPPAEIDRRLPRWEPPTEALWQTTFRGLLEVVVTEAGAIESARLIEPMTRYFDGRLLEAARGWRFHPATRGGQPVKYRKRIEIVLRPGNK